jgi:hypothetical protein
MTEPGHPELARLLAQIEFRLAEPVDFARAEAQSTIAKVRHLSAAAVYFNVLAVSEFGGRPGSIRQAGLVEQVVAAGFQTYRGEDPHPSPFDKAAMLLDGLGKGTRLPMATSARDSCWLPPISIVWGSCFV